MARYRTSGDPGYFAFNGSVIYPDASGWLTPTSPACESAMQSAGMMREGLSTFDQSSVSGAAPLNLAGQPTIILIGDSKTAYNGGVSTATPVQAISSSLDSKGLFNHINVALYHCFEVIGNSGIAGQKSGAIAARFQTDVVAWNPSWVCGMAGTNDTDSSDNTLSNIIGMWNSANAAGIKVLWLTIPPLGPTSAMYASNAYHQQVNFGLRLAARKFPWVLLVDHDQATLDIATNFEPMTGMLSDGTHETPLGASREAAYIADQVKAKINPVNYWLGRSSGDPTNLLSNPMLSGSGSATPASWSKVGTGAISYVSRQRAPAWCQLSVANGGGAGGFTQNISVGAALAVGDKIRALVEFETDSLDGAAAANTQAITLKIQFWNGSSFFASISDLYWDITYSNFYAPSAGVLQTPDIIVPVGTTIAQMFVSTYGGGNYRFSRAAVRNLTKLGVS